MRGTDKGFLKILTGAAPRKLRAIRGIVETSKEPTWSPYDPAKQNNKVGGCGGLSSGKIEGVRHGAQPFGGAPDESLPADDDRR